MHIDELDEEQDDDLAPPRPKSRLAAGQNVQTRASTMPRCFTNPAAPDTAAQPKDTESSPRTIRPSSQEQIQHVARSAVQVAKARTLRIATLVTLSAYRKVS